MEGSRHPFCQFDELIDCPLLQVTFEVPEVDGRLVLVDMAGSENIEQAGVGLESKMQVSSEKPYPEVCSFSRLPSSVIVWLTLACLWCFRLVKSIKETER